MGRLSLRSRLSVRVAGAALVVAPLLLIACARGGGDRAAELRITSARSASGTGFSDTARHVSVDVAAVHMAKARCDRELACDPSRFVDKEACMRVYLDGRARVRSDVCPRGVDADRLRICVAETRHEACSVEPERSGQLASCARSELCVPLPY